MGRGEEGDGRPAAEEVPHDLFTAHLLGGRAISENAARGGVNSRGRHHQIVNLSVFDGSIFPTNIGVNPQLSIFGLAAHNATAPVRDLGR